MTWSSPSRLDQSIACPASTVLPKDPDTAGPSALWGKEVHAHKEGLPATPRVKKWLAENYPSDIITMTWPGGRHEVVYLDLGSGKVQELQKLPEDRSGYPDAAMFFVIDWESTDVALHVDDLKTGRFMPESFTQVMAYAWASAQVHPRENLAIASYTHWPRYPKGRMPERLAKDFSRSELNDWHNEVVVPARRLALGPGAATMTNPGPHCRWCRSKSNCPEWADGKVPWLL